MVMKKKQSKLKKYMPKVATDFKVHLFCPDGYFTPDEVKIILEAGFSYLREKRGIGYRLGMINVEGIYQ